MERKLKEIFLDILDIEASELEARWDDANVWDSLSRVNILFVIEDEYDILFDEQELQTLTTPKALAEAVMRKAAAE